LDDERRTSSARQRSTNPVGHAVSVRSAKHQGDFRDYLRFPRILSKNWGLAQHSAVHDELLIAQGLHHDTP